MIPETLAMLQSSTALTAVVGSRIYDRPLKRLSANLLPTDDPLATPGAFTTAPPYFLHPSVVVSPRVERIEHGRTMPQGWAADWIITIAHYAPPGGEGTLRSIAWLVSRALQDRRVPVPQGGTGRIRIAHNTLGPEAAPEFPTSGIVTIDTFTVSSIWKV